MNRLAILLCSVILVSSCDAGGLLVVEYKDDDEEACDADAGADADDASCDDASE